MNFSTFLIFSTQSIDTLTQSYDDKWQAMDQSDALMAAAGQSDLMIVVTAVVLVIWIVLFTFLYRLDNKITKLENEISENDSV
jgi:CcmD family protein